MGKWGRIQLVDGRSKIGPSLCDDLAERASTYQVHWSGSVGEALAHYRQGHEFDLLLCRGQDVLDPSALRVFCSMHPQLVIICYAEDIDSALLGKSMLAGALQCLPLARLRSDWPQVLDLVESYLDKINEATAANTLVNENKRLAELDLLKTEFFTNISHELRTPLTVIRGMADQIEEKPAEWTEKGLELIRKNSDDLLDLVNQILDLHKLESGNLKSYPVQTDVIPFLAYIAQLFEALADRAGLEFGFVSDMDRLVLDFDAEKLQRILFNLLSNAIKFTPAGGKVVLRASMHEVAFSIEVEDTGVGIRKEILERIFDRFFQSKENFHNVKIGTGIGLALVKELVNLCGGQLIVDSEPDVGSRFQLLLPVKNQASTVHVPASELVSKRVKKPTIEPGLKSLQKPDFAVADRPNLLIVEDSDDIVAYLRACLEDEYMLSVAPDGASGLQLAFESVPDLIISDVMMPKMNGMEMCSQLKSDRRTSHIPVVLLTAKADEDSRIEGLMKGADAYLTKPFNRQELLVRLGALHTLRQTLRERYQSLDQFLDTHSPINVDDTFMVSLYKEVAENSVDPDYGVQQLCRSMALSRTQLHRKIKALTGRSTTSFVRWVRLSQARRLINNTDQRISEIAYNVGFSDPKYFSRSYQKEFGHSPTAEKSAG